MNAPDRTVGALDRRTYLGSSDIAAIMGLGAYGRSAYTTYCAKIGDPVGEMAPDDRKFLERRKRWEGPIVEMLREEFRGEIVAVNQRYVDQEHDFMAAEIDAEWIDADGATQNIEIKTVSPFAFGERHGWGEAGSSDIPVHYAAQCMYGLMVTGRQTSIVAAMVGLDNMIFYRIDRDEDTIAAMRAAAVSFWQENVLARVPPPPQTERDLTHMMLNRRGRPVLLDGERMQVLQRLAAVRASMAAMAIEEEELAFQLGEFVCREWDSPNPYLPPAEARKSKKKGADFDPLTDAGLYYDNARIGSWNKQRGAFLDQQRLKAEKPDIIADYTKEHFYRVLRISKPKGA